VNRAATLAAAFLVTFATVTGGAAVVGFASADGAAPAPEIENEHYLEDDLIKDRTPGEANVEMASDAAPQTVVIDPGVEPSRGPIGPLALLGFGGPDVTDRDIRPLANALIENGHEVRVYTPGESEQRPPSGPDADGPTPLGEELAEADAFVTFRTDYDQAELAEIETFVEADGRVVMATEPDAAFDRPGAASLDAALGTTTEPGYVYNMAENDLNYQRVYATPTDESGLTEGVDRAMFATATPVGTTAAEGDVLRPIDGSELSTSRAATDAPLLVRNDGVVMVGDSDFLSPENAQRADNDALIGNLADFLVRNDRSPDRQPPTAGGTTEPTGPTGPVGPTPTDGPAEPPREPPQNETSG
jgi:hypothetical protein